MKLSFILHFSFLLNLFCFSLAGSEFDNFKKDSVIIVSFPNNYIFNNNKSKDHLNITIKLSLHQKNIYDELSLSKYQLNSIIPDFIRFEKNGNIYRFVSDNITEIIKPPSPAIDFIKINKTRPVSVNIDSIGTWVVSNDEHLHNNISLNSLEGLGLISCEINSYTDEKSIIGLLVSERIEWQSIQLFKQNPVQPASDVKNNTKLILTFIGAVVLIMICTVICIFYMRKRNRKDKDTGKDKDMHFSQGKP